MRRTVGPAQQRQAAPKRKQGRTNHRTKNCRSVLSSPYNVCSPLAEQSLRDSHPAVSAFVSINAQRVSHPANPSNKPPRTYLRHGTSGTIRALRRVRVRVKPSREPQQHPLTSAVSRHLSSVYNPRRRRRHQNAAMPNTTTTTYYSNQFVPAGEGGNGTRGAGLCVSR